MPLYTFKCEQCEERTTVRRTMADSGKPFVCGCGSKETGRDFQAEHAGAGDKEYGETRYSQSLAMSPDQIEEHKRLFPDIKVRADGCPGFDSYRQHDDYLKKTGFVKLPQRNRRRVTKLSK